MTWAGAGFFAWLLLGLSWKTAIMLGAILIVSGPTVVPPSWPRRGGKRVTEILGFEGTTVDPIGAIIAVAVFDELKSVHAHTVLSGVLDFGGRIGIGVAGGAVGIAVLWLLRNKVRLSGILGIEALFATVIVIARCATRSRTTPGSSLPSPWASSWRTGQESTCPATARC